MFKSLRDWSPLVVMTLPFTGTVLFLSIALILDIATAAPKVPAAAPKVPVLKTSHETSFVVFASDANSNPPMAFGGKLLSEMDRCAAITVRRFLYSSLTAKDAVTVAVDDVKFLKAAKVKDLLFVRGDVIHYGNTSVVVRVVIQRETADGREKVVTGMFTFVSYDVENKKTVPHGVTWIE